MIGLPNQSNEDLVNDLLFIKKLNPHMCGIGPFIPQKDTPLRNEVGGTVEKTMIMLALLRLMVPKAMLPATTALGSIDPLGREKGLKGMGYGKLQNGYGKSSIEKYFEDCDDIDFLDAIDYFFYLIDKNIRTIKPEYQYDYDADGAINAAIAELNYRFKQHNLGYEFANSQIITIDSTFLHKTAVKPALKLLFEEGFEGAEDEIRNAYERRRKGDNKNAILEAGKAFESTMKIICDKQGYAYNKNKDTAQKLITILENNGFYPSYMNAHLTSIRTTLETGLPVVRNKVAGHGQGNQIITIPDEYTDYALHLAATNILFLVRLYRNKKQNL